MSRKVTKIPQIQQDTPIDAQQLRVAAYCRVSTRHEEQYHSLEAQISYYTNYILRNPNWRFAAVYSDLHPVLVLISAPAIKSSSETAPKER